MTKKDIVKSIATESRITQIVVKQAVQRTFDLIINELANGRRIELRDFGVFEVVRRAGRRARNPRTGEAVDVPERLFVRFSQGKQMGRRVAETKEAEIGPVVAAHADQKF